MISSAEARREKGLRTASDKRPQIWVDEKITRGKSKNQDLWGSNPHIKLDLNTTRSYCLPIFCACLTLLRISVRPFMHICTSKQKSDYALIPCYSSSFPPYLLRQWQREEKVAAIVHVWVSFSVHRCIRPNWRIDWLERPTDDRRRRDKRIREWG